MRGGGEYRVGRYYKSGDDGERGVVVTAMAGERGRISEKGRIGEEGRVVRRGGLVRRGWW